MPRIRIEWVPVQAFGLGFLGFDHLQLVFQQDDSDAHTAQDHWFVMEGVRERTEHGALLGIEGADGRTTLSVANLAAREDLIAKIGTPDYRGSRPLPYDGQELNAWETMASYARDIEDQAFPYIAYGLPGSPTPTINSSSAVASLVHYSGLDPSQRLPYGMHLSPGTQTLLGTTGDDTMRMEHGFNTLLGGQGRDELIGGGQRIEKLYGGEDDDLFRWSAGFNIIHGGEPQLPYAADGTDAVDYAGAGTITVSLNRYWIPHKVPTYVAEFDDGLDHLFSIERILWNGTSDRVVLGKGVGLVEEEAVREPGGAGAHRRSGRLVETDALASRLIGDDADNVLEGTDADDVLYGGAGDDLLAGGAGRDAYVYLPGDGDDVIVEDGGDGDELVLGGGIGPDEVTLLRPAHAPDDLMLALAGGGSILIRDLAGAGPSGIGRVVFDQAPAWAREELLRRAEAAPVAEGAPAGSEDRPRAELFGTDITPFDESAAIYADASATTVPDAGGEAPVETHDGWLF